MTRARDIADLAGAAEAGTVTGDSLVINGDMAVAQRNSTSAVQAAQAYSTVDRFKFLEGTDGTYTSEQSSTAPGGFSNSLKLAVTGSDGTLAANQYAYFFQAIEAQNLQHLKYGTASAETLTLSFWVRSSKTGTYCVTLDKQDTTRYHFIKEYSIDTADTWEYKTITVTPDSNIKSSGGAIANDNGTGIRLFWWLASGGDFNGGTDNAWTSTTSNFVTTNQVNWMDSTSNDFYLTGVKLEVGSSATPFQHESYGDNLAKCQRYYYLHVSGFNIVSGSDFYSTSQGDGNIEFPVTMRASPSIDANSGSSYWAIYVAGALRATSSAWTIFRNSPRATSMYNQGFTGATAGQAGRLQGNNASAYMAFDAEL